eukprot:COSAG06_NODE_3776_length_4917_cov_127.861976_3_plen_86_part_00
MEESIASVVQEGVPPGTITDAGWDSPPSADKLAKLGLGALSKKAETAGVASEAIEQALDEDGAKAALIALILAQSKTLLSREHAF